MGWSDFQKIKKIGEGSFGAAWLVKCHNDNKHYVIKLINVSRMPTKERDEARKEVSVLAQMKHPNIVSYIDSFEEAGNLCIVMDYCDGGDLYSKIHSTRGVHFPEEQILDWFVQITLALKHVHDRKILHRDLKSQNIFLTKEGVVKLGDFGVAKVLTNTMDFARTAIGTPYYMSPELVEHKPYNNKSDVWSLGCVLYELANMRHPFEANNMQMLAYKILRGNFEPISPKFSYELRNLVTSMLKRNPRERPSVNGILRKAFIMKRCEKFLTNDVLKEEFSHTVLHGENFMRKIQNINQPKPVIKAPTPRPISAPSATPLPLANKQIALAPPKLAYDPSKIYNAPVATPRRANPAAVQQLKKSIEKRNQAYLEQKKKQAVASPAPPSVDFSENISDRKSPYLEQLKNKRAFEEALLKKKHQEISERQKQERLKKARENGWQNVLMGDTPRENKEPLKENKPENNIYAYRHQQLDELEERRKQIQLNDPSVFPAAYLKPSPSPPVISRQNSNNSSRKRAANKSYFSKEYQRRKEEFERNRARGKAINNNILMAKPPILKKDEKSEYEENLRKIRLRNYNNRKALNLFNNKDSDSMEKENFDELNNVRNDRIAALRQQAEEQRHKLKNDLEKKRVEAFEKERKYVMEMEANNKPNTPRIQPAPPINMTQVLENIGVVGKKISKAEVLKNPDSVDSNRNRKSWQKATDLTPLDNKTLVEQTILKNDLKKYKPQVSPRKVWGLPHETLLKALEMVSISSPANSSSGSGASDKSEFQTGFLNSKMNETIRTLLMNEKEPEFLNKTKALLSPEKIATLKATKNLLLGVTFGQFDPINTKMLRTCSEPDMTKLYPISEAVESSNKSPDFPEPKLQQKNSNELNSTSKRLIKSLEELDKLEYKSQDETNEDSSEANSDGKDSVEINESTVKNLKSELKSSDEDVDEVRETMELLLVDSDNSNDDGKIIRKPKKEPKKPRVCFASSNQLVTARSAKDYEFTADSLDPKVQSLINDDEDCEEMSINGDSENDSDTEFEDDIVIPMPKSSSAAEEIRINLEKCLGEKFFEAHQIIETEILKEIKNVNAPNKSERNSFKLFKEFFQNINEKYYELLHELVLIDNDC